jgi:hypothetical protein
LFDSGAAAYWAAPITSQMHTQPLLILIRSLSFLLAAGGVAAQLQQANQGSALAGKVLDANTSQPVRMARVVLRPEASSTPPVGTDTDDSGNFKIDNLEAGRYRLIATRSGYLRQEYGAKLAERAGTVLELHPGQHLTDFVLRLTPQASVTGRVTDPSGEPVAGANVQAMRFKYSNGRPQLSLTKGSLSNDLGEYRIFGLSPGRYFISAVGPSRIDSAAPASSGSEEEGLAPTFYPSATDPAAGAPIEISGGQNAQGIDFRLIRTPVVHVRGMLVNTAGARPGRTMIRLLPRNSGMFGIVAGKFTSQIGAKGEFELTQVPTGSYVLSAESYEGDSRFSARQLVDVGRSGIDGIRLTITPGVTLTGSIIVEGQKPPDFARVRIRLLPLNNAMFEGLDTQVAANGAFALPHVAPENYRLAVLNIPAGLYLKSIRIVDREAINAGITVTDGGLGAPVEIVLSDHGGKVAGSVITAQQQVAPGALVVLVPVTEGEPRPELLHQTTSDQGGAFSLKGIAPGKYRVFAFEALEDPGICMDPEFMKNIADKGQALEVEEKGSAAVQLLVIPIG